LAVHKVGAVVVIGGGVAGIQAALDLAGGGFAVYLVDEAPALGGKMPQLSRTFPTNECSLCSFSPLLARIARHPNVVVLAGTRVEKVSGAPGRFNVSLRRFPRGVVVEACRDCGECAAVCPVEVPDDFNTGFSTRKAIYQPYAQAHPRAYVIDPAHCIECALCAQACPTGAVVLGAPEEPFEVKAGAVILCPGYEVFDPSPLRNLGFRVLPDVVTNLELERLLSAAGPFGGRLVRPSDGTPSRSIAWIQCVGSRNRTLGREYCSTVCCMAALKGAVTAREQADGPLETVVFYQEMRTPGKGFDRYRQRAEREGVELRCAGVDTIQQRGGGGLEVRWAGPDGLGRRAFDMVVLSAGIGPAPGAAALARRLGVALDRHGFCRPAAPGTTESSRPGIFVAGAFAGPKDIAAAVIEAGAAAAEASVLLAGARGALGREDKPVPERDVREERPRVGVVVCRCGTNISGTVDVPAVAEASGRLEGVALTLEMIHACAPDSLDRLVATVRQHGLNRLVVAACSPRSHKPLFQNVLRDAGVNGALCEMANIREQCAWVHPDPPGATAKACRLVSMAHAKSRLLEPVPPVTVPVIPAALVVGAGPSGLSAALGLADQGFDVHLVDKQKAPGGAFRVVDGGGRPGTSLVVPLAERVVRHPLVRFYPENEPVAVDGHIGCFSTRLRGGQVVRHGVVVLATGARESRPDAYLCGEHPAVVTLAEAEREGPKAWNGDADTTVFIQCVGSRDARRPWCSRSCCRRSLALALEMKAAHPQRDIYILFRDLTVTGTDEDLYSEARARGIVFIRYRPGKEPRVGPAGERVAVEAADPVLDCDFRIDADRVVLAAAAEASPDSRALAHLFKVPADRDGFFLQAHTTLRPVDFSAAGVFMCGGAAGPKGLVESLLEGRAAAGRCATVLGRGLVTAPGVHARVAPEKCAACLGCVRVCPFNVPVVTGNVSRIEPVQCQGCGICVAECPNAAIHLIGYRKEQLLSQVRAGLAGGAGEVGA